MQSRLDRISMNLSKIAGKASGDKNQPVIELAQEVQALCEVVKELAQSRSGEQSKI
jgi:hypothetical protein